MNQCLRCNQLCSDTSTFCSVCQSSLLKSPQQQYSSPQTVSPVPSSTFQATRVIDQADDIEDIISPPPALAPQRQSRVSRRVRIAFLVLAVLAVGALIVDSILVSAALKRLSQS